MEIRKFYTLPLTESFIAKTWNDPSFSKSNIFTVRNEVAKVICYTCVSVHRGRVPGQVPPPPDQVHPPPGTRYTPRDQVHPQDQVHPRPGTPPGTRYTPQTRYTPGTRYPYPGRRLLLRTLRILLECILVLFVIDIYLAWPK